jgi:hypothetical protein
VQLFHLIVTIFVTSVGFKFVNKFSVFFIFSPQNSKEVLCLLDTLGDMERRVIDELQEDTPAKKRKRQTKITPSPPPSSSDTSQNVG